MRQEGGRGVKGVSEGVTQRGTQGSELVSSGENSEAGEEPCGVSTSDSGAGNWAVGVGAARKREPG